MRSSGSIKGQKWGAVMHVEVAGSAVAVYRAAEEVGYGAKGFRGRWPVLNEPEGLPNPGPLTSHRTSRTRNSGPYRARSTSFTLGVVEATLTSAVELSPATDDWPR